MLFVLIIEVNYLKIISLYQSLTFLFLTFRVQLNSYNLY